MVERKRRPLSPDFKVQKTTVPNRQGSGRVPMLEISGVPREGPPVDPEEIRSLIDSTPPYCSYKRTRHRRMR